MKKVQIPFNREINYKIVATEEALFVAKVLN